MGQYFAKTRRLRRVGCADYRADRGIAVFANRALSPFFYQTAHVLVHRYSVFQNYVLDFRARGVRSFYQNEDTFVVLFTFFHERNNPVRTKVAVDGNVVGRKSLQGVFVDLRIAEERLGIAGRR